MIIDFSCSFKMKQFQLIDIRLDYKLLRQQSQCIFVESHFSGFFSSLHTLLHARVSSNPAGLINSGCPLGLDTTRLHLLGEVLAYLVNTLLAEARLLELGSEQHSGKVSTEKTSVLGRVSNRDEAQPLPASGSHNRDFTLRNPHL